MNHKIYVDGGLGNQLFQVAWALYLSENLGLNVTLDVTLLEDKLQHNGVDFRFLISDLESISLESLSSSVCISRGVGGKIFRFLLRNLSINKIFNYLLYDYHANMDFSEANRFYKCKHHLGYFQFPEASLFVRDMIKSQIDKKRAQLFDSITKSFYSEKVALHIRRGDFLQSSDSKHQNFGLDYIFNSINSFPKGTQFVVFSDDLKWCITHLSNADVFFSKETSAYCDFLAMTFCKDYIFTGSTFGYWAALLSDTSCDNAVVVPKNHTAQYLKECNLIKTKWIYRYV